MTFNSFKRYRASCFIIASICLVSLTAIGEPVRINGSTTMKSIIFNLHEEEIEVISGTELEVKGLGSSRGVKKLLQGEADMAIISAPLYKILEKNNLTKHQDKLREHKVGETIVSFAVHKSNPISTLTQEQVKSILLGEITSWKGVDGDDKPIKIITEYSGGGIRTMVEQTLLSGKSIHQDAKALPKGNQIAYVAERFENAFAVLPYKSLIRSNLKPLQTNIIIKQPLAFATLGNPTTEQLNIINTTKEIFMNYNN